MRISDWSSDVCSFDLLFRRQVGDLFLGEGPEPELCRLAGADLAHALQRQRLGMVQDEVRQEGAHPGVAGLRVGREPENAGHGQEAFCRSEEHTSELQSLMRISYAVFCLKKKKR